MTALRLALPAVLGGLVVAATGAAVAAPPNCDPAAWAGEYFVGSTPSGTPVLTRCDPSLSFDWGGGSPAAALPGNGFSARWTRTLALDAGDLTLRTRADDGLRVRVDGRLVLDAWTAKPTVRTTVVPVAAGSHTVVVEYHDDKGQASLEVALTPPTSTTLSPSPSPSPSASPTPTTSPTPSPSPTAAPELVANGDLALGPSTMPDCFSDGSWGRSTRTAATSAELPPGTAGRSWRIEVSDYVDGDAKLMPSDSPGCAATVDATRSYTLGIWYRATTSVNSIPLFTHVAGQGWEYWTTLATLPSAADWTRVERALPALPAGTTRLSFGVAGEGNGALLQTGWSLRDGTGTTAPPVVTEPDSATGLAATGRWSVLDAPMPLNSVHATLLRDGRVLLIAGSGNDPGAFTAGSFRTSVWDPATGVFTDVSTPVDMFCAGHVTLPDGRVLIAGGTLSYPGVNGETSYRGAKATYVFDPATNRYSPLNETIEGHWYPTLTKLENGDVWSAGGYDEANGSANSTEMFDLSAGRWLAESEVPQTYEYWGTYPHMFLLADGRLFYSGGHTFGGPRPGTGAVLHDWRTKGIADIPGLRSPELRDQAGTVLLPPAQNQTFMIAGGGYTDQNRTPTNLVDIVDLNAATPAYRPGPDLPGPGRQYLNLTSLPDRTVLAANGSTETRGGNVSAAALYDVLADKWTSVPADPVGRNYHSSALLLPDGRVLVFGSNPADGSFELRISVYEPPYLFEGARPTITTAPAAATYGQSFDLGVTGTVASAALTSVGSATHQTDTNVRLVDLPITGTGGTLRASVPQNPALLPPGPYLLTVLDSNGVPSVAKTVQIR